MSKHWFTSDTHFGHARIIELSKRPFKSVSEMDEALIANWNARVNPEDIVWHLGDFAFGHDPVRLNGLFHRLNGTKHLVIGNHDELNELVLPLPWATTSMINVQRIEDTLVTMCHYPMRTWPGSRKGSIHLFGHMHLKFKGTSKSLNVGVDVCDFAPVLLKEIKSQMKRLPVNDL